MERCGAPSIPMHKTLFISDLHLTPKRPDITDCFVHFMRTEATECDALYVLGDLFDFWVGDDDNSEFAVRIQTEFRALTQRGIPCYFIHGNRDFLVGKRFAKNTGVILLHEEYVVDLYGQKTLLLHGDTLCTKDVRYLEFRKKVHQPWLQWLFNRLPLFIKRKLVAKIQQDIRSDKQQKAMEIMDVTPEEVEQRLTHHNVNFMIHGHTHRPFIHQEHYGTRIVLGDWYDQGSVCVVTKEGFTLEQRAFLD